MESPQFMPGDALIAGIREDVARYEAERIHAHRAVRWRVPVFLAGLVAFVAALAYVLNGLADPFEQWTSAPHIFVYVFALVAAIFVYGWAMGPATKLQQSFRDRMLPIIFGFIDNVRYRKGGVPDSFERMPKEVIGTFNRQSFDDLIAGSYEGFPFELYEATLSHKAGKSSTVAFKGIIVAFETIAPFPGMMVAARRSGAVTSFFRGLFKGTLQELQCGVPELDEAYEFRTDKVEAARPLVTGRLPKALAWLGGTWPEQPARIALRGSDGFLVIPLAKNFFELPGISVSLDYQTHVAPMIADMAALLATASLVRKVNAPDEAIQV